MFQLSAKIWAGQSQFLSKLIKIKTKLNFEKYQELHYYVFFTYYCSSLWTAIYELCYSIKFVRLSTLLEQKLVCESYTFRAYVNIHVQHIKLHESGVVMEITEM